jgi:hypothetical protein
MDTADYSKIRITENYFRSIEMAMLRNVNCAVHVSLEGSGQKLRFEKPVLTFEGRVL